MRNNNDMAAIKCKKNSLPSPPTEKIHSSSEMFVMIVNPFCYGMVSAKKKTPQKNCPLCTAQTCPVVFPYYLEIDEAMMPKLRSQAKARKQVSSSSSSVVYLPLAAA